MAIVATKDDRMAERITRNRDMITGSIAFDSSYPTGGELATVISRYFRTLEQLLIEPSGGYLFAYDKTNNKILVYLSSGTPAIAAEAAHTHAVALDGGNTGAEAAHTHTMPGFEDYGPADILGVTVGTPALVHNADPTGNLAALPLYGVEGYGAGGRNIIQLFSTTNGNTDIVGSVDDVSGICGAATPRFYVNDSDAPGGVKIYVEDTTPWKLEFVSPTATDGYIIMPFEAIADGVPGYAYAVKVTHAADAATGVELEFDDNGAVNAQLIFVDGATTSRVINPADIEVLAPSFMAIAQAAGTSSAGSSHTHDEGTLVDAASAAGSSHLHTATGEPADEVGSGDSLAALTAVKFIAIGRH